MAKIDTFKLKGQILDARYQVESVVGEGGFGVVYRATQVNFDEPVAIKVLKIPGQLSAKDAEVFVETFRAEGKHLRKLSAEHPAFVRAHDTGVINVDGAPAPYLVLEWLDGSPLEDDLAERREKGQQGRTLQESMELVEPIFGALAHAHAQRVAHRDIKPANIFVIRTKNGKSTKLLDFGMAKVMTATGTQGLHAATQGGLSGLTPAYAAPEQWDKKMSATGPWTDVYSLALVLVELLTDKPPLDGDDMPSLMASTLDEEIRPTPTVRGAVVDSAVEAVFAKALALHPKDRYRHAGEFWNALLEATEKVAAIGMEQTLARIVMPEGDVLQPGDVALEAPAARKIPETRLERGSQSELGGNGDSARISQKAEKSASRVATAETSAEIKVPTLPPPAPTETKKSSSPVVYLLAAILVVLGIIAWKWQGGGSAEKTAALPTVAESKPAPVETAEAPKPKKKGKKWWEETPDVADPTAKAAVPKLAVNRQKWLGLREQSLAFDAEKKREDAEKTLRSALDLACKEFGEDDPACAETMKLLAMVLFRLGKLEDAEKLLRQAVKLNEKFGDEDDEEFDDSRQALIAVLVKQGKTEEAKEFWKATDPPLAPPKPSASAAPSGAPKVIGAAGKTPSAAEPQDNRDPWTQIIDELHEEKIGRKPKAPAATP